MSLKTLSFGKARSFILNRSNPVVGTRDPLGEQLVEPGFEFAIEQFTALKLLGSGGYARVELCKHNATGALIALKTIKKSGCLQNISRERKVVGDLMSVSSPFLVRTYGAFQDDRHLYYVLEYVPGGELFAALQVQKGRKFPEDTARFYMAEVVLALEYLHSECGIIHRDLKPENVLMADNGHIKLIDFGFAKHMPGENERTFTVCGTPDYTAPEVIKGENGYGFPADYWALGVLMYEMVVGHAPFFTNAATDTGGPLYTYVMAGVFDLPKDLSPAGQNLIKRLLCVDVKARLGTEGGIQEIKNHVWFRGIDWAALLNLQLKPPRLPAKPKGNMCFIEHRPTTASEIVAEIDQTLFRDFGGIFPTSKDFESAEKTKERLAADAETNGKKLARRRTTSGSLSGRMKPEQNAHPQAHKTMERKTVDAVPPRSRNDEKVKDRKQRFSAPDPMTIQRLSMRTGFHGPYI